MPIGARRVSGLVITAIIAGTITASGLTAAVAAPSSCDDEQSLRGVMKTACVRQLQREADSAGRAASIADEAWLRAKRATAAARKEQQALERSANRAAAAAVRSRARAGAVAAQLARGGGEVGRTTQVLLSGDGADRVLYHLSRMSELATHSSRLATAAVDDERDAERREREARSAADALEVEQAAAKKAYAEATEASSEALAVAQRAAALLPRTAADPGPDASARRAWKNLPSDASTAAKVLAYARAQIGEPYVFGAAGPSSWDCSGLTLMALGAAGVSSVGGHGATVQYTTARSRGLLVPYSAVQPGDLLFYTAGGGDMYHVAIYSGAGRMVEAARPGTLVREVPVRTAELFSMAARFTG